MAVRSLNLIACAFLSAELFAGISHAEQVTVTLGDLMLQYSTATKRVMLIPGRLETEALAPAKPWEAKALSPNVHHLRVQGTTGQFLKIDTGLHTVSTVLKGEFGEAGGVESLLTNAFFWKPPPYEKPVPGLLHVRLGTAKLTFDSAVSDVAVICEGIRFLDGADIEIISLRDGVYHLRLRGKQDPSVLTDRFWKIDTRSKKAFSVNGRFGETGGHETPLDAAVALGTEGSPATDPAVHADLGADHAHVENVAESPWYARDEALFHGILAKQRFDVLVVPVQVQDHAFDRNERILITQLFVRRIRSATHLAVADPLAVERALGWGSRTFPIQRVYKLANLLRVKKLVRLYAGHNRDMKMRLTAIIQEAPASGTFDTTVPATQLITKDLVFTDEDLPFNSFAGVLPDVLSVLQITAGRKTVPVASTGIDAPLPGSPMEIALSKDRSLLVQALHVSLLGAMCPDHSRSSQEFFVRSLALLQPLPQDSKDVVFLKAYALANLYRRPAALALLKAPATPEQAALRSYLDGDLGSLLAHVERIGNPIPRLLMLVLLNDLRWAYDYQGSVRRAKDLTNEVPAGWKLFAVRRFTQVDPWDIQNNLEIKKLLDEIAPVGGYSLQDISRGMLVRGELSLYDPVKLDTSVQEHRTRYLLDRPWQSFDTTERGTAELDILDLAAAWAEETVLKSVRLRVYTQGLYEAGIELVDKYDSAFRGHPELTGYKVQAMQWLARQKHGDEHRNLDQSLAGLAREACVWSRGQYWVSSAVCATTLGLYETDFPRRPFWRHASDMTKYGDRTGYKLQEIVITSAKKLSTAIPIYANVPIGDLQQLELDLRYSEYNFHTLQRYHDALEKHKLYTEADMLLDRNKHRFKGSPAKVEFMANYLGKRGRYGEIVPLCEEAMLITPDVWTPYFELGKLHLAQGETQRARDTFDRFPLFALADAARRDGSVDAVTLSNNAYAAGALLHQTGAIEDARSFFKLSVGYRTGSSRSIRSEYWLALYEGSYARAAESALSRGRRYAHMDAYSDYLRLFRIVWNSSEVESLFLNLNMMDSAPIYWEPIITSFRMDGRSDDELRRWLSENSSKKITRYQAQRYYLRAFLLDRGPDTALPEKLDFIEQQLPTRDARPSSAVVHNDRRVEIPSIPALFASSRNALLAKRPHKAYSLFGPWMAGPYLILRGDGRTLLPLLAWSAAMAGKSDDGEKVLEWYITEHGRDFEYWLSMAMLQAARGDHGNALRSLDLARCNVNSSLSDTRFVPAWYQLVEACELLFENTRNTAYRDRTLELAQRYQRMDPLESWPYAVEAKHAPTAEERLRPLAFALYLDPGSFHLSVVPAAEKDKARAWFTSNNPFRTSSPPPRREAARSPEFPFLASYYNLSQEYRILTIPSFPRKLGSSVFGLFGMPAFAGMTQ
jgi:hypothetical protein